ncbi:MAG: hypothetical protein HS127_14325 [Planctomycetia bacterium]|nr:hypothetical protein [Planctomycetia bacterium]
MAFRHSYPLRIKQPGIFVLNKHINLLLLASENLLRHRAKTVVVCLCIIAIVTPFITAISISDGIRAQSLVSKVNEGGDLYLTFDEFGRNTSVPLKYLEGIRHIFGVKRQCRALSAGLIFKTNWR